MKPRSSKLNVAGMFHEKRPRWFYACSRNDALTLGWSRRVARTRKILWRLVTCLLSCETGLVSISIQVDFMQEPINTTEIETTNLGTHSKNWRVWYRRSGRLPYIETLCCSLSDKTCQNRKSGSASDISVIKQIPSWLFGELSDIQNPLTRA